MKNPKTHRNVTQSSQTTLIASDGYQMNQYVPKILLRHFNTFRHRPTQMGRTPLQNPQKVPRDIIMPWNIKLFFGSTRSEYHNDINLESLNSDHDDPRPWQSYSWPWRTNRTSQLIPCLNTFYIEQGTPGLTVSHLKLLLTKTVNHEFQNYTILSRYVFPSCECCSENQTTYSCTYGYISHPNVLGISAMISTEVFPISVVHLQ